MIGKETDDSSYILQNVHRTKCMQIFFARYKASVHVETILATVEDYNNDFTHVMPE
jgi:hypothetical protein